MRSIVATDLVQKSAEQFVRPKRLAIVSTHPIQYHSPWFRALASHPNLDLSVFYGFHASPADQASAGFGVEFDWDIPLLDGYRYTFVNGECQKPRSFFAVQAPRIAQMLAEEHVDAVLVNGWHYRAAWQTIFACWKRRIPVMIRGDSQLVSPRSHLKRFVKYPAYRSFIPRFDACLAVGTRSRDYYLHYGARPDCVFLVPHAIQDGLFQNAAEEGRRQTLRREWGIQTQHIVFLFAGKLIEKKRPMDFLRAIAEAVSKEPRVAGLVVGDGPLRVACEQFARSLKLPMHFTGFLNQSQIGDAYMASDCLVLPSDGRETWGWVVNEAMSCARPAIVSDAVGCGPDLVCEGRTGAVFPLGNIAVLSRIIMALARNPAHMRAMGERARAGLRPYSLDAAVRGVVDAVAMVVKKRQTK